MSNNDDSVITSIDSSKPPFSLPEGGVLSEEDPLYSDKTHIYWYPSLAHLIAQDFDSAVFVGYKDRR